MNKTPLLLALKLIASKAEKLAYDVENNKLWPGDLASGLADIASALKDTEYAARNDR